MDQHPQDGRDAQDEGFTLIEVVVAMAVFAVLAGSVFGVLTAALRTTGDNARRSVAAGIASSQIEQARSLRAIDIPDGLSTSARTVGGTTYTVDQTATYVTADGSASVCATTGDELSYKLVRVAVSWPDMGSTRPATADTLRALGIGADGLAQGSGLLAVTVLGANGNPVSGTVITAHPGGAARTTGSDGCAVFAGLAPGTYTASIDQPGRVASTGRQALTTAGLDVSASRVTRTTVYHDVSRSRRFVLAPPAGHAVPAGLAVAMSGTFLPESAVPACSSPAASCTTGVPGTLQTLFPDTYALWAGTCSDARSTSPATFDATPAPPGAAVQVPLGGVSAAAAPGRTVYAVHASEDGSSTGAQCRGGERYTLGTASTAAVKTALPLGTWTITANPTGTATGDPVVTLTSSAPTAAVVVP